MHGLQICKGKAMIFTAKALAAHTFMPIFFLGEAGPKGPRGPKGQVGSPGKCCFKSSQLISLLNGLVSE